MKLKSLIKQFQNKENIAIFTHDNPDPDCVASAYTLKLIAKKHGVKGKIFYGGSLTRSENKAMVEQLKIEILPLSQFTRENFDLTAIVDTQKGSGNNSFPEDIDPDITFDHHASKNKPKNFYDIDSTAGATSTIILQYFLKEALEPDSILATAYCYAIIAETKDMDRGATRKDIRYFNQLYSYADHKAISRIRHAKKPITYFDALRKALNKYKLENGVISCYLGKVKSADYIPEIADTLIDIEEVHHSIVIGEYKRRFIASARTNHRDINLGKLLNEILKDHGTAGGHDMIAAGQFQGEPESVIKQFRLEVIKLKNEHS